MQEDLADEGSFAPRRALSEVDLRSDVSQKASGSLAKRRMVRGQGFELVRSGDDHSGVERQSSRMDIDAVRSAESQPEDDRS